MNRIVSLLALWTFLTTYASVAQQRIANVPPAEWGQKNTFKGSVKRMMQVQSPLASKPDDILDGASGENYAEEYDKRGLTIKRIYRDDFNQPKEAVSYEYDSRGRQIASTIESLSEDRFGTHTSGRIVYAYNDAQNTMITYDNRTIMDVPRATRTIRVHDTTARYFTTREYQKDTLISEELIWFDKRGYVLKSIFRRTDLPAFTQPRFDKESFTKLFGQMTEAEEKTLDSLVQAQTEAVVQRRRSPTWYTDTTLYQNQYDSQNRLVRQEEHGSNELTHVFTFAYTPEATLRVSQSFNKQGDITAEDSLYTHPTQQYILRSKSRFRYEGTKWREHGYEQSTSRSAPEKPVEQYKYDSHGNWIEKRRVNQAGKQIGHALIRTFDYY